MQTKLEIFGTKTTINSDKQISDWIKHDYGRYVASQIQNSDLIFNLELKKPEQHKLPELTAKKYHEDYIIYDNKQIRFIDFFGKALIIYETQKKHVIIQSETKDKLYEIFQLSFETLLGEELDKKGYHRIHCLALEKNGNSAIILLPPGGGKSTLAFKFLKNNKIKVLTEDIALYKNGKVYGLHTSWATRDLTQKGKLTKKEKYADKITVDTTKLNLARKAEPKILMLGERITTENSTIKKIGKTKMIMPLFKSMVLGLELQQSLAYFLLRNYKDGFSKSKIGISRLKAMTSVLIKIKTYKFRIGTNTEKNYNLLNTFLEGKL